MNGSQVDSVPTHPSEAPYHKYLNDRRTYVNAVARDAFKLRVFEDQLKARRENAIDEQAVSKAQIRAQRLECIFKRCAEAKLDPDDLPTEHKLVKVALPLSDSSWQRMKDTIFQIVDLHEGVTRLSATELRAKTLSLPAAKTFLEDPRIKAMLEPEDSLDIDPTWQGHRSTIMALVDDLCAAQRLSLFCMLAEGLEHAGFELDKNTIPPLSHEQIRLVDEVLADARNQFVCSGQSLTYSELELHHASNDTPHTKPHPFHCWLCDLSDTRATIVVSMDILRMLREIEERTGITHPTSSGFEGLVNVFVCKSYFKFYRRSDFGVSQESQPESWSWMLAHFLRIIGAATTT
ncbi:BQ2448_8103 [Microbotryum intermedium]|uniref:BQ2448_8103 protein n=1 Tax=Microbotryum intermedium TaxID=269621 RepID=A0A238FRG9_9BASI|nr:BQ2448_8103 [Microbotryum intermedium]